MSQCIFCNQGASFSYQSRISRASSEYLAVPIQGINCNPKNFPFIIISFIVGKGAVEESSIQQSSNSKKQSQGWTAQLILSIFINLMHSHRRMKAISVQHYYSLRIINFIVRLDYCNLIVVILFMATSNNDYGSHYGRATSNGKGVGRSTIEFLVRNDVGNYLHHQENIAQRTRHGLFSQPMGIAQGDHYHDKKPDPVPINISTNNRLIHKVGPQLFEKMGSTNIGDLYKDKFRGGQLYLKEKSDLSVHNHAFAAGGRQKLVKHSEFEHMKQYEDKMYDTRGEDGKVKLAAKNILTNNMKKGFGNTNTDHLFGPYQYRGSPYDNQRQLQSNQRLAHKAKILKPFLGGNHPQSHFTPHHQTFYNEGQPYQPKNDDAQYRSKTTQKWNVNNPNKKGFYGTFTEFPRHIQQGQKPKAVPIHENVWRPNYNGTSKGVGQTLSKPSPVGSQMILNSLRRNQS